MKERDAVCLPNRFYMTFMHGEVMHPISISDPILSAGPNTDLLCIILRF